MTKAILTTVLTFAALAGSWQLIHGERAYAPETVHTRIQTRMIETLPELILKAHPLAYDIDVSRCWTKNVGPKTIKAFFEVDFKEKSIHDTTTITKMGFALLTKNEEVAGEDIWDAKDFKVEGQSMAFSKGLTL
jgi:hypothetical protein